MMKSIIALLLLLWSSPANALLGMASSGGQAGAFVSHLEDEFVGPFMSWTNVKTSCNAFGDGVTDDTSHIQTCLNNLIAAGSGTLYFPAGTYKITSGLTMSTTVQGVQIVGADPATTIIKWAGSVGGVMLNANQFKLSKVARITWDGNSSAATGIWEDSTSGSSTNMLYEDDFFQNITGTALLFGNGASGDDAEVTILRCHFMNNGAGVSPNASNALDIWVWYSKFSNNGYGINNGVGRPCGMVHAFYNDFLSSSIIDIQTKCNFTGAIGNFSSGSAQFFHDSNCCTTGGQLEIMDNVIVGATSNTVISTVSEGMLKVLDNKIGNVTGNGPLITLSNNAGPSMLSVGNTYSNSNVYTCTGGSNGPGECFQINDTVGTVTGSAYNWPTPANLGRTIIDLSPGANAATIQMQINAAVPYKGTHPVIHFPAGAYPVSTTLTIPAGLDVQFIGDGYGSVINFSGTGSVFKCSSPCKMSAQDFQINGNNADGFLIGTEDSVTARVQARGLYTQNVSTGVGTCAYLNEGLTNTRVNTYGAQGGGLQSYCVIGTGSSAPSVLASFGSGWGGANSPGTVALNVTNSGNLVMSQVWFEGYYTQFMDLESAAGNVTWDGGIYAPYTFHTNMLTLNNYSGTVMMTGILGGNAQPSGTGYINVTNPSSNTNALFIMMAYNPGAAGYWNVTAGGNVYSKQSYLYNSSSGFLQAADQGAPSNPFILSSLAMLRATLPSPNWSLPPGVTDARLQKLEIQNVTNAVHVRTGI